MKTPFIVIFSVALVWMHGGIVLTHPVHAAELASIQLAQVDGDDEPIGGEPVTGDVGESPPIGGEAVGGDVEEDAPIGGRDVYGEPVGNAPIGGDSVEGEPVEEGAPIGGEPLY